MSKAQKALADTTQFDLKRYFPGCLRFWVNDLDIFNEAHKTSWGNRLYGGSIRPHLMQGSKSLGAFAQVVKRWVVHGTDFELSNVNSIIHACVLWLKSKYMHPFQIEAILLLLYIDMRKTSTPTSNKLWHEVRSSWLPEVYAHVVYCRALDLEYDRLYLLYALYAKLDLNVEE